MTANLTVPADVWACKQPGVPLVAAIVEGERCDRCAPPDFYEVHRPKLHPPAWLVALRDARCEHPRCQSGRVLTTDRHGSCWVNCRHCVAGRLLHDVRVQCGTSVEWPDGGIGLCDLCFGTGHITVRCLVDVVPVVLWHDCTDRTAHVCAGNDAWTASGVIFHTVLDQPGETEYTLTPAHVDALAAACGKPPADWVAGYAVILTEVGQ